MDRIKCIRFAKKDDLERLSELFNLYRCFYGCESDLSIAVSFLSERLEQKDSIIFVSETENNLIVGFAQLYPTFSSLSAKRAWLLNDLYVDNSYRRYGVATKIIHQALKFCRETSAVWLSLQTGVDNMQAQALYKRIGFTRESYFCEFSYKFSQ